MLNRIPRATSSSPAAGTVAARLPHDTRGVTTIEFAFVAAPFIALILAVLQVTLVYFAQQTLETTASSAARQLMTGAAQASGMTQQQFKNSVCSKLPAFMTCANVMVDVRATTDFASVSSTPALTYDSSGNVNNNWTYAPGTAGQITTVKVMYIWPVNKGPLGFDLSTMSGSNRLLVATAVFKTEPYSS